MRFKKRHPKVGASPGTLIIPQQAPTPRIHAIHYGPDRVEESDIESLDELDRAFHDETVSWIDVQGFGDKGLMQAIGEKFGFHRLLLEDVVNVPQRPKTEVYDNQVLVVVRMVRLVDEHEIDMEQVSIVFGPHYVLTFQERYGDVFDPVRKRIRSGKGMMRKSGSDYLVYALADTVIDGYYPVLELLGDQLDELDEAVVTDPSPHVLRSLNEAKNELINLRRGIWPQRDAVAALMNDDVPLVTDEVRTHLRDTLDHCVQTSEIAEMYREMATGLINTYMSSIANRTNEVMKVLTIMASIFIPLTFIAGIYGMNFDHMPELHSRWSYPVVLVLMGAMAGGMVLYFWRKGWLK
jgi:magnesium transporter